MTSDAATLAIRVAMRSVLRTGKDAAFILPSDRDRKTGLEADSIQTFSEPVQDAEVELPALAMM